MADTAAYLTDHVIPEVPTRTWTLTFPMPLRYLLAYDPDVLNDAITVFAGEVTGWLRRRAMRELGLSTAAGLSPGMITWVQRFGSAANLNVHLHSLATEGVFLTGENGRLEWRTVSAPERIDVDDIAWRICTKMTTRLRTRGMSLAGELGGEDGLALEEPLLAACYAASIQGFVATGERAGSRAMEMGVPVAEREETAPVGPAHGFSLFAGRCISAKDRRKREHVIRYVTRPPLPERRLSWAGDGDVLLELKRPWSNGTTHIRYTGPELIERMVALVPRPRVNGVRYHGVFAPNARLRPDVIALARAQSGATATRPRGGRKTGAYLEWAHLMRRVFELDVTRCPRCGVVGMQRIAVLTRPDVVRAFLVSIGAPTGPPKREPARVVEPDGWDWDVDYDDDAA